MKLETDISRIKKLCEKKHNVYEYLKAELRHNGFDDYPDEYDNFDEFK